MTCSITDVILDPEQRRDHIGRLLAVEGLTAETIRGHIERYKKLLSDRKNDKPQTIDFLNAVLDHLEGTGFVESPTTCYSGLALTGVPKESQPKLFADHQLLKEAIFAAGLANYDPAEAPFNPQGEILDDPCEVSDVDILMVVSSRYFTFTNLAPSSGGGMEERTANLYNKVPLVVMKKGIYVSRMTTGARRVILLEYTDLQKQKNLVTDVFGTLQEHEPGIGTCKEHANTLAGFKGGQTVCLPGLIEKMFPALRYDFNVYKK